MRKYLTLFLTLLLLLTGCGKTDTTDPPDTGSEDLGYLFEGGAAVNEIGSLDFGMTDPLETVYDYTGEPLEIPFRIAGATIYGAVDLSSGNGKTFEADDFTGTTLIVNGEYADIADVVLPNSMGGQSGSDKVAFLNLPSQEGKLLSVESSAESGIVSASDDGKYIITCIVSD